MFYVSLLEQNITKKERVSIELPKLDAGDKDSKKYKVEAIWDNAVYINTLEWAHLLGLYYLVA